MTKLPRLGPRATLRRLTPTDLRNFQAYRHDPLLGRYQGWSPLTDQEASAFLDEMNAVPLFQPGVWCQLGIADPVTDELLGDIGVCVACGATQAEIGFTLRAQSQGHGIATAAVADAVALVFQHTAVEKVIAITDTRNAASIRLLERLSMQRLEAKAAMFRGEACVEHTFAVARDRTHMTSRTASCFCGLFCCVTAR